MSTYQPNQSLPPALRPADPATQANPLLEFGKGALTGPESASDAINALPTEILTGKPTKPTPDQAEAIRAGRAPLPDLQTLLGSDYTRYQGYLKSTYGDFLGAMGNHFQAQGQDILRQPLTLLGQQAERDKPATYGPEDPLGMLGTGPTKGMQADQALIQWAQVMHEQGVHDFGKLPFDPSNYQEMQAIAQDKARFSMLSPAEQDMLELILYKADEQLGAAQNPAFTTGQQVSKDVLAGGVLSLVAPELPIVGGAIKALGSFGETLTGLPRMAWAARAAATEAFAGDLITYRAGESGWEDLIDPLIEKYPMLKNPVLEYLKADPNDSALELRAKNALGSAMAAFALTPVFQGTLNLLFGAKRLSKMAADPKVADETFQAEQQSFETSLNTLFPDKKPADLTSAMSPEEVAQLYAKQDIEDGIPVQKFQPEQKAEVQQRVEQDLNAGKDLSTTPVVPSTAVEGGLVSVEELKQTYQTTLQQIDAKLSPAFARKDVTVAQAMVDVNRLIQDMSEEAASQGQVFDYNIGNLTEDAIFQLRRIRHQMNYSRTMAQTAIEQLDNVDRLVEMGAMTPRAGEYAKASYYQLAAEMARFDVQLGSEAGRLLQSRQNVYERNYELLRQLGFDPQYLENEKQILRTQDSLQRRFSGPDLNYRDPELADLYPERDFNTKPLVPDYEIKQVPDPQTGQPVEQLVPKDKPVSEVDLAARDGQEPELQAIRQETQQAEQQFAQTLTEPQQLSLWSTIGDQLDLNLGKLDPQRPNLKMDLPSYHGEDSWIFKVDKGLPADPKLIDKRLEVWRKALDTKRLITENTKVVDKALEEQARSLMNDAQFKVWNKVRKAVGDPKRSPEERNRIAQEAMDRIALLSDEWAAKQAGGSIPQQMQLPTGTGSAPAGPELVLKNPTVPVEDMSGSGFTPEQAAAWKATRDANARLNQYVRGRQPRQLPQVPELDPKALPTIDKVFGADPISMETRGGGRIDSTSGRQRFIQLADWMEENTSQNFQRQFYAEMNTGDPARIKRAMDSAVQKQEKWVKAQQGVQVKPQPKVGGPKQPKAYQLSLFQEERDKILEATRRRAKKDKAQAKMLEKYGASIYDTTLDDVFAPLKAMGKGEIRNPLTALADSYVQLVKWQQKQQKATILPFIADNTLSGPPTAAANAIGLAITAPETLLHRTVGTAIHGGKNALDVVGKLQDGAQEGYNLMRYFLQGFKGTGRRVLGSYWKGRPIGRAYTPGSIRYPDLSREWQRQTASLPQDAGPASQLLAAARSHWRLLVPGQGMITGPRLNTAVDDLIVSPLTAALVKSDAYRRYSRQGYTGVELERMVDQEYRGILNRADQIADQGVNSDGFYLDKALQATLGEPFHELAKRSRFAKFMFEGGEWLQDNLDPMAAQVPGLGVIPVGSLLTYLMRIGVSGSQWLMDRNPAGLLGKSLSQSRWKDLPLERQRWEEVADTGKRTTGALALMLMSSQMFSGDYTGSTPVDPDIRSALLKTGWQPYSRVKRNADGSLSYEPYTNVWPLSSAMALLSDTYHYGLKGDYRPGDFGLNNQSAAWALGQLMSSAGELMGATPFASNIENLLSLGIQKSTTAYEEERQQEKLARLVQPLIPYGAWGRLASRSTPFENDVHGGLQALEKSMPYLPMVTNMLGVSNWLNGLKDQRTKEPRLNLFGEPRESNFAVSYEADAPLARTLDTINPHAQWLAGSQMVWDELGRFYGESSPQYAQMNQQADLIKNKLGLMNMRAPQAALVLDIYLNEGQQAAVDFANKYQHAVPEVAYEAFQALVNTSPATLEYHGDRAKAVVAHAKDLDDDVVTPGEAAQSVAAGTTGLHNFKSIPGTDALVHNEMLRFAREHEVSLQPIAKVQRNMDLENYVDEQGRSAYWHLHRSMSTVKLDDMTFKQALKQLIRSPEYRNAKPTNQAVDSKGNVQVYEDPTSQWGMIRDLYQRYKDYATELFFTTRGDDFRLINRPDTTLNQDVVDTQVRKEKAKVGLPVQ